MFWDQFQKKPEYIYKRESVLNDSGFKRKIQLYGSFYSFTNPAFLKIPIEKNPGFSPNFSLNNWLKVKKEECNTPLFIR